jgi:hypothetical protein
MTRRLTIRERVLTALLNWLDHRLDRVTTRQWEKQFAPWGVS